MITHKAEKGPQRKWLCHLENMGYHEVIFGFSYLGHLCIYVQDMSFLLSNVCPGGLSTDHDNDTGQ